MVAFALVAFMFLVVIPAYGVWVSVCRRIPFMRNLLTADANFDPGPMWIWIVWLAIGLSIVGGITVALMNDAANARYCKSINDDMLRC